MPLPRSLAALVARQDGVVSRRQAITHGVSERTVARWGATGQWQRLHPGVYLVDGHRPGPRARVRAAALWAGDRATVTGPAAAWWQNLYDRPPERIDVTVPRGGKSRAEPGVVLHRSELARADRVSRSSVWVARPELAVLQTAVVVPRGSAVLDRALQQAVTLHGLRTCHHRNLGVSGSTEMGRLLAAAADGAESQAERMLIAALRAAGVTGWVTGHPVGRYRIDVAFPAAHVAVEVDGWAWHSDVERFQADRRKGNVLVNADWRVLRFTWHDLDGDPAGCVDQILTAVAKRDPRTGA